MNFWNKRVYVTAFKCFFLRFSRGAVEAFIAKPLQARERLLNERAAEIKTLEAFYQGSDNAKRDGGLTCYLRYGQWAEPGETGAPTIRSRAQEKPGAKAQAQQEIDAGVTPIKKSPEGSEKTLEPANFEAVVNEIHGDLDALQDYLKNSVFYAAGFITYCNQELERIRNRFKDMEDNDRQWIGVIRTAVKYERNPNIPYSIAHTRRDFRMRREIALELKDVRETCTNVF